MEYKIEIPKLCETDFMCPCNPFVEAIGACTCANIRLERLRDASGTLMFDDNKRREKVYAYEKGKIVERSRRVGSMCALKSLDEMKLGPSQKSPNLTNRVYVHNLKS
jgi:hypothetical protein